MADLQELPNHWALRLRFAPQRAVNVVAGILLASFRSSCADLGAQSACEDKRDDCWQYVGRGPLGGGCVKHPEYMHVFCSKTCGFCNVSEQPLQVEELTVAGTAVKAISSRGVRQWLFFELPVSQGAADAQASCASEGQREGQCEGGPASTRTHVAMAHYYDSQSHALNSLVYRWDLGSRRFAAHQELATVGAWDLAAFCIRGDCYLAIASFFDGQTRRLNSTIFRWDPVRDSFVLFQEIETEGAMDVESLVLGEYALLVFTGNPDNRTGRASTAACSLLLWNGTLFERFQVIEISGGYDTEAFTVDGGDTVLLAVVHEQRTDVYGVSAGALWDPSEPAARRQFQLLQHLEVAHGRDAEHFFIGGELYLALAVFRDARSYSVNSSVFLWNGITEQFQEQQGLQALGAFDAEVGHTPEGEPALLLAGQRSGITQVYRWGAGGWSEAGNFPSRGVYDISWHHVKETGEAYLGIARFWE